ncbi:hypothetical protein ARMGADRAFT_1091733 [Armillaria gallica]|uniref:Uncharacterized protein n=1 Tax=Armillaria gallica TaxID=47427 RepID=A0A2H3CD32_ARMGA|nr:hypothetical protein ARMGADRAFT_1091733 [Armillaria gallica]
MLHLCLGAANIPEHSSLPQRWEVTAGDGTQKLGMRHLHSSPRRHAQGDLPWKRVSVGVSPLKANVGHGF